MRATQLHAAIIANARLANDHYRITLAVPASFAGVQPGQFVHVKINDTGDPLLRRPLSIHRIRVAKSSFGSLRYRLDILYAVKGKGTVLLSKKRSGESLDMLGPLGKGFDYQNADDPHTTHILIAGGMGVAPLALLAEKIASAQRRHRATTASDVIALIGGRTHDRLFCEEHFKKIGCSVFCATEDGSRGIKGTAVDLFTKKIMPDIAGAKKTKGSRRSIAAYGCGPRPMLKNLAKVCLMHKIPLQVSLEEFMGCGIGVCLGCVIETKGGYERVCSDGPVFWAQDISWNF